jgi:hypothetical protein
VEGRAAAKDSIKAYLRRKGTVLGRPLPVPIIEQIFYFVKGNLDNSLAKVMDNRENFMKQIAGTACRPTRKATFART